MSILRNFLRTDLKCMSKFIVNMGIKGMYGFHKFQQRRKRGENFPAFQFISVTNDCNLKCQGCWVIQGKNHSQLDIRQIQKIIEKRKKQNSYFFGILGGEPLMYKSLFEIFENNQDCYFQLFTNGTLLTDDVAKRLRKLANVTPLISFEGNETVADIRRGAKQVYSRTLQAVEAATQNKLITGVAISVCKSNIEMALSDEFVNMLHDKGVVYLWYYIYRPSGENPSFELALSDVDILHLRQFLVDGRTRFPMVLIDSYWRADGEPFCPAADGLSHHINPDGFIEPCPVIQFSADQINSGDLKEIYEKSEFIKDFKADLNKKTNGCIFMEDPKWLIQKTEQYQAHNSSNNPQFVNQLANYPAITSHGSCPVIRERNWIYRFAKRKAFFGLGAYG